MIQLSRNYTLPEKDAELIAIKVIGVGGAGSNALDRVVLDGLEKAELIAMNTDVQSLASSVAGQKIQLGRTVTRGLGAGGDPEIGYNAAFESADEIRHALSDARMVFICAGLGGGTGSGAAPAIAQVARENDLAAADLATGDRSLVLRARSSVVYSQGYLFYERDGVLVAQRFDPGKLRIEGDPIPVASEVRYDTNFFRGVFDVSSNGTVVFQPGLSSSTNELATFDRGGKKTGDVTAPGGFLECRIAPDEKTIALTMEEVANGTTDIWLQDVTRGIRSRFTFGALQEGSPVWSPDGGRLAYSDVQKVEEDIYVKDIAGGDEKPLFVNDENKEPTAWSPDGQFIACNVRKAGQNKRDIWLVPANGGAKPYLFIQGSFDEYGGNFSPDGKWFSYISDESGRPQVYLTSFPDRSRRWQISTDGGVGGVWSRNMKEFLFVDLKAGLTSVEMEAGGNTIKVGKATPLFNPTGVVAGDMFPDAQQFLLIRQPDQGVERPLTVITDWTADLRKAR